MSKHTPGPWRVGNEAGFNADGVYVGSGMDERRVAYVHGVWQNHRVEEVENDEEIAEYVANARLIATAPDLLAAAKAVRATCPCDPDINPEWNAAWDALIAAIAKAEGGAA